MTDTTKLTSAQRKILLRIARDAIEAAVTGAPPPHVPAEDLPEALLRQADTFVTLYHHGELRGCIGSRTGREPLYRSVMDSAIASATRDPRFPPVTRSELGDLDIHISILTPPRRLSFQSLDELRTLLKPYVHGVILSNGPRRALYLPQVWEHFEGTEDHVAAFLTSLSRKAGDMTGTLWKEPNTKYEVFEAESFGEEDVTAGE